MSVKNRYPNQDRYINLLTDFGFKRLFGTEPNKEILIDFLNVMLPPQHAVQDVSYRNNENLGNTPLDRKAIFDIYCESQSGEKFIVEIQKAKQNYFKDRSVYYATFPIQEQAIKGKWDYKLSSVYTIGILDFIFDDHKDEPTLLHTVQLKNQRCEVFYEKLKFIYVELPKFTKTVDELESHFEKWLFLLRNLSELEAPPEGLQEVIFEQLFEVSEIANFSAEEQEAYENSLKYYRDLQNVVDTSRQEGMEQGWQEGREQGWQEGMEQGRQEGREQGQQEGRQEERLQSIERQRSLLLKQLARKLGDIPDPIQLQIAQLPLTSLEALGETLFDLENEEDLRQWLNRQ
ncbi:MAG: Rpn family recombination-promoting nuclease/putative transposase [Symploca sp. SIO1B1]|nr:Rpn family recombination-promoting nuclease/putative transposase [Symploca sp. SIO1B1]